MYDYNRRAGHRSESVEGAAFGRQDRTAFPTSYATPDSDTPISLTVCPEGERKSAACAQVICGECAVPGAPRIAEQQLYRPRKTLTHESPQSHQPLWPSKAQHWHWWSWVAGSCANHGRGGWPTPQAGQLGLARWHSARVLRAAAPSSLPPPGLSLSIGCSPMTLVLLLLRWSACASASRFLAITGAQLPPSPLTPSHPSTRPL